MPTWTLIGGDTFAAGSDTNLNVWTPTGTSPLSGYTKLQSTVSAQAVVKSASGTLCQPYYSGTPALNAYVISDAVNTGAQKAEATGIDTSNKALILHAVNAATHWNGYAGRWNAGSSTFEILRVDNGTNTQIATGGTAPTSTDVITLESDGAGALILAKNGTTQCSVTDSTYTTGKPGVAVQKSFTTAGIDNFKAYHVASGTTAVTSDLADSVNVRAAITSSLADSVAVRSSVTSDLADSAIIRAAVAADLADSASIRAAVAADLADSTNLRAAIAADLVDAIALRAAVTADLADSANIRAAAAADLADSVTLRAAVIADLADSIAILSAGQVTSDLADSIAIRAAIAADLIDTTAIRTTVAADLADSAAIRVAVQQDLADAAIIRAAAAADLADSVDIRAAIASDLADSIVIDGDITAIMPPAGGGGFVARNAPTARPGMTATARPAQRNTARPAQRNTARPRH